MRKFIGSFESRFSPGKSREVTSGEIIRQAVDRNKRKTLTTANLFAAIGKWSPFYLQVMFLNGLVYGLTEMHSQGVFFTETSREDHCFKDCEGVEYDWLTNDTVMTKEKPGNDEHAKRFSNAFMLSCGDLLGSVFLVFSNKEGPGLVFGASMLYAFSCGVMYIQYLPILKFAQFTMASCTMICRIAVLMHCLESVPAKLRPLGMFIMMSFGVIWNDLIMLILINLQDWWSLYYICAIVHVMSTSIYLCFIPPSVLRLLYRRKTEELTAELEKWRKPQAEPLDVTALIDDVNFRGHVAITKWETLFMLLKVPLFRNKLIIIGFSIPLVPALTYVVDEVIDKMTFLEILETQIVLSIFRLFGFLIALCIVSRFGRRMAFSFSLLLACIGQAIILMTPVGQYDVCEKSQVPEREWSLVALGAALLVKVASKILEYTTYLMLIEHLPTTCRRFALPLVFVCTTSIELSFFRVFPLTIKVLLVSMYPSAIVLVTMVWAALAAIGAVLMDNSGFSPATTAEIPCYRLRPPPYPKDPIMDDNVYWESESGTKTDTQG